MHELSLAKELIDIAITYGKKNNGRKIISLKFKYGKISMIEPECFSFYFDELSKGTMAEGAVIEFEEVPLRIECNCCFKISEPEELIMICPFCGQSNVKLINGNEMFLESIEVDL